MGSEDNSKDLGLWRDLLSPSQMCQEHLPDLEVLDPLVGHEILEPPKEDRKEASPSHFDSQHPSCWLSFLPSYSPKPTTGPDSPFRPGSPGPPLPETCPGSPYEDRAKDKDKIQCGAEVDCGPRGDPMFLSPLLSLYNMDAVWDTRPSQHPHLQSPTGSPFGPRGPRSP